MSGHKKISFVKIASMLFLYGLFLAGVYYKAINLGISKKITASALVVFFISSIIVLVIYFKIKSEKKVKFISIIFGAIVLAVLAVNLNYLRADYFIPHTKTSINNRFFVSSMSVSRMINKYLDGKVLVIDETNKYHDWEYGEEDRITLRDVISMNYSPIRTEVSNGGLSNISEKQKAFLLGLDQDDYVFDINTRNWNREYYFYYGKLYDDCEKVVFLTNEKDGMYFIPYELFLMLNKQVK